LNIRLAERHIRFLGELPLCGTVHSQKTLIRTAAALGILLNRKIGSEQLNTEFLNYFEVDDRTVFYMIFNHRNEAESLKVAAQIFARYCGKGLDVISSLVENRNTDRLTLDDILDEVDALVVKRMKNRAEVE